MGEARRRKLAANRPADNSLEAIRRLWCSRSDGPVEDFVAPVGTVSITFDIVGTAPSTCMIDASQITGLMASVTKLTTGISYHSLVRRIAGEFLNAKQTGNDQPLSWIGIAGVWTAMHHPKTGDAIKLKVADALRRDGKAHITWHFNPAAGLGIAIADGFIDLEALIKEAPTDTVVAAVAADSDTGPMH
jgi:hypothetical protein